jgi:hypothetical protein
VQSLGPVLAATSSPTTAQIDEFRAAQRELWIEQRQHGNPWLISDFVSAGSPLTHAALLLAPNKSELVERQMRFELPMCPPLPDDQIYSHRAPVYEAGTPSRKNSIRVLNSGAMFACTRWTNVWFPCRYGLFGDPFGGRLQPLFGNGILDVPVTAGPKWRHIPILPHVSYWRANPHSERGGNVAVVRDALDLGSTKWLPDPPNRIGERVPALKEVHP